MRRIMVSVSTGGPRIDEVNDEFRQMYLEVNDELKRRGIQDAIPFPDLWQWYSKWSSDLTGYASRRTFVAQLFDPIVAQVKSPYLAAADPTGWVLVDRQLGEARMRLAQAKTAEQYQAVGLICREALISLGQEVFSPERHPVEADIRVSKTDFKRMIEAYIAVELRGSSADEARRHARSALDLALRLQHQRTAAFRDAAICIEATSSVISIIAILSGYRDPQKSEPSSSVQRVAPN